jgi:hypothetical protein
VILPLDVLASFVDRIPELARFHRMLAGETDERILLVLERGETGKTCFLLKLAYECEQQDPPVPVVPLDFDQRRSGLTDFLSVAREVRRCLGDDSTPDICACEVTICRPDPAVNIQTGGGDAGVDWGQRGRFNEADISDVAGRDRISVQTGPISGIPPAGDPIAWQKAEMGRALRNDLAGLADTHQRVVLLIDTFEHASEETCTWLERWLFDPLRRDLRHVLLVISGRPECGAFFAQPRLWTGLIATIDRFTRLGDDDIREHYHRRGLSVPETELPLLLDLARVSPARMAQVGDWLEQTRGGGR